MTDAAEDVNEIFSRLFDHRPFLQTEIHNFKKEFEERRGDREVEQLFRALELITEIKQAQIEKIVEASDANLPRTIADIQVALHMCEETEKVGNNFNSEELLKNRREERVIRFLAAEKDIEEKERRIVGNFEQRKAAVQAQYDLLEQKLTS